MKITTLLCGLGLLFLAACSAEPNSVKEYDESRFFQKITAKMALEHGQIRYDYRIGVPNQSMTFLLKNLDVSTVSVNEWFMNETDNIRLFYAFCEPGKSAAIPDGEWKLAWPDAASAKKNAAAKKQHRRSTLILQPNNNALLEVPLSFLEHVDPPVRKARYTVALCAQIALNTLQTKSEVFEITVFPQTKDIEF